MATPPKVVGLVLNLNYGEKIPVLANQFHVWVPDTPANQAVAERIWKEKNSFSETGGVTTFKVSPGCSAAETCIGILDTIEEHHNAYSQNPPYRILEIIGLELTELKNSFRKRGFNRFENTRHGFRASKSEI